MMAECHKENSENVPSGLSLIELQSENPIQLFKIWHNEAKKSDLIAPNAFCLATSTRDGQVTARHLLLRRLDSDGFIMMTDNRSKKSHQLVRIEGEIKMLERDEYQNLYDREPAYAKIRAHICHQGLPVDWDELKQNHDKLYEAVVHQGKELPMPIHFVAYKMLPKMMEFYFSVENKIADRITFLPDECNSADGKTSWKWIRIAA